MNKYVIIDEENGMMLAELYMRRERNHTEQGHNWTSRIAEALHFELEEAQATIQFINDVIDWELAQNLSYKLLEL